MLKYIVQNIITNEVFFFDNKKEIYDKLKKIFIDRDEPFIFENFIIKKNKCFGCINDKLDQRSHMECPEGCLHCIKYCDFCSL